MAQTQTANTQPALDTRLRQRRQHRFANPPEAGLRLHREIAARLVDDLADFAHDFRRITVVADEHGVLRTALRQALPTAEIHHAAISPSDCGTTEIITLPTSPQDLVIGNLALHHCNDIKGVLWQLRQCLKPDGLLLQSLLGAESLRELRQSLLHAEIAIRAGAGSRLLPLPEFAGISGILPALPYALPLAHREMLTIGIPSFAWLVDTIRKLGMANYAHSRTRLPLRRDILALAQEHYTQNFSIDTNMLAATIEVIYLQAWVPAASQQQALRPGSAQTRLATALDTTEISTGEKTGL